MVDIFGQELLPGDWVAFSAKDLGGHYLKVGIIIETGPSVAYKYPNGYISIQTVSGRPSIVSTPWRIMKVSAESIHVGIRHRVEFRNDVRTQV